MSHFYKQNHYILNERTAAQKHSANMSLDDWNRLRQSNPDHYAFLDHSNQALNNGRWASVQMAKGNNAEFANAANAGDYHKVAARGLPAKAVDASMRKDYKRGIYGGLENGTRRSLVPETGRPLVSQVDSGRWLYNDDVFLPDTRKEKYKKRYSLKDRARFYKKHPDRLIATVKHKATKAGKAVKGAGKAAAETVLRLVKKK